MFKLEINCGGAAFMDEEAYTEEGAERLDPSAWQVREILKEVSEKLEAGYTSGNVHDVNGNTCGKWFYREDAE